MSNASPRPRDVCLINVERSKCMMPPAKVAQLRSFSALCAQAPSWHAIAMARASRPLGVRPARGRLIRGPLSDRISQAPSIGDGRGGVCDTIEAAAAAAAAAALRLEAEADDLVEDLRSAAERDGLLERDLSL